MLHRLPTAAVDSTIRNTNDRPLENRKELNISNVIGIARKEHEEITEDR